MADEASTLVPRDGNRVDVRTRHELEYWTRQLGVDANTLKATVNRVGPMLDRVLAELGRKSGVKPSA